MRFHYTSSNDPREQAKYDDAVMESLRQEERQLKYGEAPLFDSPRDCDDCGVPIPKGLWCESCRPKHKLIEQTDGTYRVPGADWLRVVVAKPESL